MAKKKSGAKKTELTELPHIDDRVTFIYIEHAKINRQDSAITVTDQRGIVRIPAAMVGVLLLGPGTDISHRAVELIVTPVPEYCGSASVAFVIMLMEIASAFYAILEKRQSLSQYTFSTCGCTQNVSVRFPDEDVSTLTMQQLRGREGARIRRPIAFIQENITYIGTSENTIRRILNRTPVNQALSAANVALYGIVHSVIVAIGMSPGLGFIHTVTTNLYI